MKPNIRYKDIQAILDEYDSHKGVRRKLAGDHAHIRDIKQALSEAMRREYGHLVDLPVQIENEGDYDCIIRFAVFSYKLDAILAKKLEDEGSVRALKKIQQVIENSEQGAMIKYWSALALLVRDCPKYASQEGVVVKFFSEVYQKQQAELFENFENNMQLITQSIRYCLSATGGKINFFLIDSSTLTLANLKMFDDNIRSITRGMRDHIDIVRTHVFFNEDILLSYAFNVYFTENTFSYPLINYLNNLKSIYENELECTIARYDYLCSISNLCDTRVCAPSLATPENMERLKPLVPNSNKVFRLYRKIFSIYGTSQRAQMKNAGFNTLFTHHEILLGINSDLLDRLPPSRLGEPLFNHIIELCQAANGNTPNARDTINQHLQHLWDEVNREREVERQAQAHEGIRQAPVNRLNAAQSTHTASVHESVSESAIKLKQYYKPTELRGPINILKNLSRFKKQLEDMNKSMKLVKGNFNPEIKQKVFEIETALKVIKRLISSHGQHDFVEDKSRVSTNELLAIAIQSLDETPIRTFQRRDGTSYVADRKDAENRLIRCLYEVARGYNLDDEGNDLGGADSNICTRGTFNKIMESLVSTNICVEQNVITKDFALAKLKALVREAVKSYLQSMPSTTDEDKKNLLTLLVELKKEGVGVLWDKIKIKVLEAYSAEFSRLYTNDARFVDKTKIQDDVEGGGPYTEIDDILKAFKKTIKASSPATGGIFSPDNKPEPSPTPPEPTNTPANKA